MLALLKPAMRSVDIFEAAYMSNATVILSPMEVHFLSTNVNLYHLFPNPYMIDAPLRVIAESDHTL